MSKKHFEAIAIGVQMAAIRAALTPEQHLIVARTLAEVCAAENPRFDAQRFIVACGVAHA